MTKLIVVALLAAATPALVQAEIAPTTVSRTVRIAELDLRSPAGVAELDRRIAAAAREMCGNETSRDLWQLRASATCRADAVARAKGDREAVLAAAGATRLAVR